MHRYISFAFVIVFAGLSSLAEAGERLFSEIAMDSVFTASSKTKAAKTAQQLADELERETRLKKLAKLFELENEVEKDKAARSEPYSLIGRWSASLSSGHIFAIELTKEKKFNLVHLSQGKSTISSGTFVVHSNQLKLNGETGSPLAGEITWSDVDQFAMKIGTSDVRFKRAK